MQAQRLGKSTSSSSKMNLKTQEEHHGVFLEMLKVYNFSLDLKLLQGFFSLSHLPHFRVILFAQNIFQLLACKFLILILCSSILILLQQPSVKKIVFSKKKKPRELLLAPFLPWLKRRQRRRNSITASESHTKSLKNLMHTKFLISAKKKQYCFYILE